MPEKFGAIGGGGIRPSRGAGGGSPMSSQRSTAGPPFSYKRTAFIAALRSGGLHEGAHFRPGIALDILERRVIGLGHLAGDLLVERRPAAHALVPFRPTSPLVPHPCHPQQAEAP